MKFGSVCSGIEAASVAWHPLGWEPQFYAEIDPFPCAVLAHHYGSNLPGKPLATNGVPNLGDFTKIEAADVGPIELLVGGTPCQSFSVAGKRLGLDDPRGNLALEFLALARRLRPRWLVFENLPGLLSSDEGRDFGAFLGLLGECGYGWSYRVFDAQYVRVESHAVAVPQRRRRVFVVGYFGDWRPPAAVLLEPEGLRGDPPPRREAGQRTAGSVKASLARCSADEAECGTLVAFGGGNTSGPIDVATAHRAKSNRHGDFDSETFIAEVADPISAHEGDTYTHEGSGNFRLRNCVAFQERGREGGRNLEYQENVAYSLNNPGGGGRRQENCIAFSCKDHGQDALEDHAPTLRSMNEVDGNANAGGQLAVAFQTRVGRNGRGVEESGVVPTLNGADAGATSDMRPCVATAAAVRRLTPRECERLQGFPDDYTLVPYRGRPAKDGPRYKALGNSMAVNVMRWIGERIDLFERVVLRRAA